MKPLQVWMPLFDPALSNDATRRDLQRALQSWDCETTIWVTPWSTSEGRWPVPDQTWLLERAIISDRPNRIDIYHIGPDGFVFGPLSGWRFREDRLGNLLNDWLSVGQCGAQSLIQLAMLESFSLLAPTVEADGIRFEERTIPFRPLGTLSAEPSNTPSSEDSDGLSAMLDANYLPGGPPNRRVVSPAAESNEYLGTLERDIIEVDGASVETLVSRIVPDVRSLKALDVWPDPLGPFFRAGGGPDAIHGNQMMKRIAERSREDPAGALVAAREYAAPYLSEGDSPLWNACYGPMLLEHGPEEVLMALSLSHNLDYSSWDEARRCPAFEAKMRETVTIQRVFGVLGLFWALLIEELESGQSFQRCKRCNRMIQGRADKRFCSEQDNPECWRERRASSRKRLRAKSKRRK